MKPALVVGFVLLVVAIAFVVLSGGDEDTAEAPTADENAAQAPTATVPPDIDGVPEAGGETVLVAPVVPPTARPAEVARLADGDSFDIVWTDTGERDEVRLLGLNSPELDACFGRAARDELEALLDGPLAVDVLERDDFGRAVADVWVGDRFVNAEMVGRGAAVALSDRSTFAELIRQAQDIAEANQRGLWSPDVCGSGEGSGGGSDLAILDVRADAPGRDDQNPNGEWVDIVNLGAAAADLTGWSIRDESTRHRFDFPDGFTLPAGEAVRVFSGCGTDSGLELYWCDGDPVWNNTGDTAFLVDPAGRFADTYRY